jgi:hypothetical protein
VLIPGTTEAEYLKHVQEEIDDFNSQLSCSQYRNKKRKMTPERLYKDKKLECNAKGGLDFVWYAFEVYKKLLFPYYCTVKAQYLHLCVIITENSATPHIKACKLLKAEIKAEGLEFIVWPANSPDLHPKENFQKHHKALLEDLCFEINSAAKHVKDHCKEEMRHNVPHGLAAHPGWPPTFAKPPPKPSHSDAKQLTLALYRTIQPKISFRVDFYCLLTRTRVMPGLTAPSTPPLRWFTCFSAHPPL